MNARSAPPDLLAALKTRFGERFSTARAICERHGQDESYHTPHPPDAVVFPRSSDEVVEIVRLCAASGTPLIPYGVGTSLEGNIAAVFGGVCVDLGNMNRVIEVNVNDLDCRVEPGVTRKQLNAQLHGSGLFFRLTRVRMQRWAAWLRRAVRARWPFVMAPCAKTCSAWRWYSRMDGSSAPVSARANPQQVTISHGFSFADFALILDGGGYPLLSGIAI